MIASAMMITIRTVMSANVTKIKPYFLVAFFPLTMFFASRKMLNVLYMIFKISGIFILKPWVDCGG